MPIRRWRWSEAHQRSAAAAESPEARHLRRSQSGDLEVPGERSQRSLSEGRGYDGRSAQGDGHVAGRFAFGRGQRFRHQVDWRDHGWPGGRWRHSVAATVPDGTPQEQSGTQVAAPKTMVAGAAAVPRSSCALRQRLRRCEEASGLDHSSDRLWRCWQSWLWALSPC